MTDFLVYIKQARNNLNFLSKISYSCSDYCDWQVTVSFYVGVHLVNAHLTKKIQTTYRSHKKTFDALNFACETSPSMLPQSVFLAYRHLYNLSRRSRYLCSDADLPDNSRPFMTYSKHLKRSINHLNTLIEYIESNYGEKFDVTNLDLIEIQGRVDLKYFKHMKKAA